MEFEQVKSYLSTNSAGGSVYDHLCKIVRYISEEQPQSPLAIFENISKAIKDSQLPQEVSREFEIFDVNSATKEEVLAHVERTLRLFGKIEAAHNENDEEETATEEAPDMTKVANLLANRTLFEWGGIGMAPTELFALQNSATELVKQNPSVESSRFFGKFIGMASDYFVIECTVAEHPEPAENKNDKDEDPGQGVNEHVYFVCSDVFSSEWIRLPYVSAEQIKASRKVRTLLTGNLENTHFGGRFYFPWNEAVLLRCQISRIVSACTLAPAGHFALPEEPDESNPLIVELAEEFAPSEEPSSMESWVHSRGLLRLEGRLFKYEKPEADDEDAEEKDAEPTPEEAEEVVEILRPISTDASPLLTQPEDDDVDPQQYALWTIRASPANIPMQVTTIRSVLWPGAMTIYENGSRNFVNVYVGTGLKFQSTFYVPEPPLIIQQQFDEFVSVDVPNPDNEEETITQQKSIFDVQEDVLPPPPEENAENAGDADAEEPAEE